jgi:hypothetical protein
VGEDGAAPYHEYQVDYSTREITAPIDLHEDGGVAAIVEGGWQARPTSPAPEEISIAFSQFSARFSVSGLVKYIERNNAAALIQSQIAYQGKKKLQAIAAYYSDSFYGYSTGVRAVVSGSYSAATSHTLTLTKGYGNTAITDGAYIHRMFKPNRDYVALVRSGALVTNGYGLVTAKASSGTIDVTWAGSITPAANDEVVLANAMYDTAPTLAETDYNKGLVGLLEAAFSTSVHGLSSASVSGWAAAHTDRPRMPGPSTATTSPGPVPGTVTPQRMPAPSGLKAVATTGSRPAGTGSSMESGARYWCSP